MASIGCALLAGRAAAQSVLFDFEDAPPHGGLPLALSGGGVTATFTATGLGFSVQPANTMGFAPAGFSGLCLYPNGVFASDLGIAFSRPVSAFSILYAPQELGCDDSATMRVTAFRGATEAGTATAVAPSPGTWPGATLAIDVPSGFDRVVVHYDHRPPTCQDWGPIFLADNVRVVPMPEAPTLSAAIAATGVRLAWPVAAEGFRVEASADPAAGAPWTAVPGVPFAEAGRWILDVPADLPARFFRLARP